MAWIVHHWRLEMAAGIGYAIFLSWLVGFLRLATRRRDEDDARISRQLGSRDRSGGSRGPRAVRSG